MARPGPRTLFLMPALVAVLALPACGSDEPSAGSTTTTAGEEATTTTAADTTTTAGGRPGGPPGGSGAAAPAATFADVAYASTSDSQVLDIWVPDGADEPAPLVIYVHGGAFKMGDKAMVGAKVAPLLEAGYAVASVNYRLSGEALFPAGPQDVKAAVRWLRANADEYGIDPDRFAAWGESAGGNLVSLLGTTGDQDTVLDDPSLGNPGVSSAVQAVVSWFGPTDFLQMDTQSVETSCTSPEVHDAATSPESTYLGSPIQDVPELADQANPIAYVDAAGELPPFSLAHGDADCNVPHPQSEILADALEAAGGAVTLTILPGATHADAQFDGTQLQPAIEFLDEALGA